MLSISNVIKPHFKASNDVSIETPLAFGQRLIEDNILDYKDLINNKDVLIKFLACMIENNRLEILSENNIQEFLENMFDHHVLWCDGYRCFHKPYSKEV